MLSTADCDDSIRRIWRNLDRHRRNITPANTRCIKLGQWTLPDADVRGCKEIRANGGKRIHTGRQARTDIDPVRAIIARENYSGICPNEQICLDGHRGSDGASQAGIYRSPVSAVVSSEEQAVPRPGKEIHAIRRKR